MDRLSRYTPQILGIFRILGGAMFACHGAQKVFGAFGGMPPQAPQWIVWTAGPLEFFGGVLVAIGLFTRPVAFVLAGLMACAYFYGHNGWRSFFPKVNGGEIAVLYCWLFLYISAAGPGAWALDNLRTRRRLQPAHT